MMAIALESLLSGWFALISQRRAVEGLAVDGLDASHWDVRSWGTAGILGASMLLLGASAAAWVLVTLGLLPGLGPSKIWAVNGLFATGFLMLLGFIGLILEALRPPG